MNKYIVSVIDFDGKDVDVIIEGIYLNECDAVNSMKKVFDELLENAMHNGKKHFQIKSEYGDEHTITKVVVCHERTKRLFQINLHEISK